MFRQMFFGRASDTKKTDLENMPSALDNNAATKNPEFNLPKLEVEAPVTLVNKIEKARTPDFNKKSTLPRTRTYHELFSSMKEYEERQDSDALKALIVGMPSPKIRS